MNDDSKGCGIVIVLLLVAFAGFVFGSFVWSDVAYKEGLRKGIEKIQELAVKEGAAEWVSSKDGKPEFKFLRGKNMRVEP